MELGDKITRAIHSFTFLTLTANLVVMQQKPININNPHGGKSKCVRHHTNFDISALARFGLRANERAQGNISKNSKKLHSLSSTFLRTEGDQQGFELKPQDGRRGPGLCRKKDFCF